MNEQNTNSISPADTLALTQEKLFFNNIWEKGSNFTHLKVFSIMFAYCSNVILVLYEH